ncbi:MAG: hypothetical protein DMF85_09425 [Acidobacteria bacterium]|nr:MAG: hypothetical protein DMF85_09425 [Acidobacteriota bacterium]
MNSQSARVRPLRQAQGGPRGVGGDPEIEAGPAGVTPAESVLDRVRWLARRVLAPDVAGITGDVPFPWLVTAHPKESEAALRDYVFWWIRHPETDGAFDAKTRWVRWLPARVVLRLLLAVGYDGLIYARGGRIVGVPEGLEGGGYAAVMLLDFVAHAAHVPGITRARVGRGRNNITRRLLARLKRHADALGWQIGDDGWVTFRPPSDSARPVAAHDQISSAASSNDASV